MNRPADARAELLDARTAGALARALCVGDALREAACPGFLRYGMDIELIGFSELVARAYSGGLPDLIISALVSQNFDCVDIALLLQRTGFDRQYRVIASDVPDPEIVRREIKAVCPNLDFDVVSEPPSVLVRLS